MLSTGFMSMWISNTATSIMMLPIATSVLSVLPKASSERIERPLLLSIAWAANIGGMATLIGTPPNMIFAGFLSEHLNREIGFVEWLPVGLSATTLLGLSAFFILSKSLKKVQLTESEQRETEDHLREEWSRLGAMTALQKARCNHIYQTALLWILRPYLGALSEHIHWSDTGISLIAALLLFSITAGGKSLLDWESTSKLPWEHSYPLRWRLGISRNFTAELLVRSLRGGDEVL